MKASEAKRIANNFTQSLKFEILHNIYNSVRERARSGYTYLTYRFDDYIMSETVKEIVNDLKENI